MNLQFLMPQEERLEVIKHKRNLLIGIPKETLYQEKRICLTPDAVQSLVLNGHQLIVEAGAGILAGYTDKEYADAGAEVTHDTQKVFKCPIILKVEPLTLSEIEFIQPETIVLSALQLKTRTTEYFKALSNKKITALAFEFIKDEGGSFPAVKSLSEIAGTAAVLIAAELMSKENAG